MEEVLLCVLARTGSSRLPSKVLHPFAAGESLLGFLLSRLVQADIGARLCVCTTVAPEDDAIVRLAERFGVEVFRGSVEDVPGRLLAAADFFGAKTVVRINADNPFTAVDVLRSQVHFHLENGLDYCRLARVPHGLTAETLSVDALRRCIASLTPETREFFMLELFRPERFSCGICSFEGFDDLSDRSITVDTKEELDRIAELASLFPDPLAATTSHILRHLAEHPGYLQVVPAYHVYVAADRTVPYEEYYTDMRDRHGRSMQGILTLS